MKEKKRKKKKERNQKLKTEILLETTVALYDK